jgi:methionine salvage enolase-phosphatase E1
MAIRFKYILLDVMTTTSNLTLRDESHFNFGIRKCAQWITEHQRPTSHGSQDLNTVCLIQYASASTQTHHHM